MSNQTEVEALIVSVAAHIKRNWTFINGKADDLSALDTTDQSSLVAALNEIKASIDSFVGYTNAEADARVQAAKGDFDNTSDTQWASTEDVADQIDGLTSYSDDEADARVQAAKGDFTTTSDTEWASTTDVAAKIAADISTAIGELIDGSPDALNTLNEIAAALQDNPNVISEILVAQANRVAFDQAQTLTTAQQLQACENIGIGDPRTNWWFIYTLARDGFVI